jgi:hypothetical protein
VGADMAYVTNDPGQCSGSIPAVVPMPRMFARSTEISVRRQGAGSEDQGKVWAVGKID